MARRAKRTTQQTDLFGEQVVMLPTKPRKYEVHEHAIISGPRSRGLTKAIVHSHEGGNIPHTHPDMGPACYTIDKDEWHRMTGLKGGGRKQFTDVPTGEQFPFIARTLEENSFEIHVGDPPPGWTGSGGGFYAASRMVLAFGMTAKVLPFTPTRKSA